jgi:AraC family transcriptional regulator
LRDPAHDLQSLAAKLFQDPTRIELRAFRLRGGFPVPTHRHDRLLQMAFICGGGGQFTIKGVTTPVRASTAWVCYPREPHSQALLTPAGRIAELHVFKIHVEPSWPAVHYRIFESVTAPVQGELMLLRAMRRATRLGVLERASTAIHAARVAEALCLWPGSAQTLLAESAAGEPELDQALRAVPDAIDRRLSFPPALEELADLAHLSTRHFTRRFRQAMGVSPHEFMTSRRLERAKDLLLQGDLAIGEVAETLGFSSLATFSRWFAQRAGAPPSSFRQPPTVV